MIRRFVRRAARATLARAVRSAPPTGWGAAVLADFDQTTGAWEAVRWSAGGLRVVWRERTAARTPAARRAWRAVASMAMVALVVGGINQLVVTVRYVPSVTMEPTIAATDRILVDRLLYRVAGLDSGDIVLYRFPRAIGAGKVIGVARLVAVAGDRVECRDGRVHRNGTALAEPYLPAGTRTECASVTVPAGSVYLLSDNRQVARDSREFGPVAGDRVVGRVVAST